MVRNFLALARKQTPERRSLHVNSVVQEAAELLAYELRTGNVEIVFDLAEDPSIIYEHVWRVGDVVMWDNLACLHARTDWPSEQRRTLRRCTVEGEPLY